MSGLYASTVHVNYNGNDRFPEDVPVVSRLFADAGYRCGLAGKLHLASTEHQVEKRSGRRVLVLALQPLPALGRDRRQRLRPLGR